MRIIAYILIPVLFFGACTSARWIAESEEAVVKDDYVMLSSHRFLQQAGPVTPQNPVLNLRLYSVNENEYAERVLLQRYMQDYRPNIPFMILGMAGAGLAFYTANSDQVIESGSGIKSLSLNAAGGLLGLISLINMKPHGEPRPTGETRYLRRTGSVVMNDTVLVDSPGERPATVRARLGEKVIIGEQNQQLNYGALEVNLAAPLSDIEITGDPQDVLETTVTFEDSVYTFVHEIEDLLEPYARITSIFTELRDAPADSEDNILTELAGGSQLRILDRDNPEWFRVQYGVSETFIARQDAEIVWRSSDFVQQNTVVTVAQVPFGNIDVESNIPVLRASHPNGAGIIVANEDYGDRFERRRYAERDARLIREYLETSFGVPAEKIVSKTDVESPREMDDIIDSMQDASTDSTELIVYLSGYAGPGSQQDGGGVILYTAGAEPGGRSISLNDFFRKLSDLSHRSVVVFADLDFSGTAGPSAGAVSSAHLQRLAQVITGVKVNSAVLFSAQPGQQSALYFGGGEDKKHHLFAYFIARAIQERITGIGPLFQYLQRNLPYNSRRLHDRAQDPLLYGRRSINLLTSE